MVAYATEVDKRRKSTDSSNNSPVRSNSGLSQEDVTASNIDDVFEGRNNPNSQNFMSMKFKNSSNNLGHLHHQTASSHHQQQHSLGPRGVVSADSPYARALPVHNSSSKSHVPSALASIASLEDIEAPNSPLPGEKLPEHHFKKRYFAEKNSRDGSRNGSPPLSSSSPT